MAQKIAENLWRLDIPLVGSPLKNLNSYLILGERNLLIDTGFRQEPCREAMERQLLELGVDRDRTDIFLTHLHSDHAGLSTGLIRPGCDIFMSTVDGKAMQQKQVDDSWRDTGKSYLANGFSEEEMADMWGTNPAKTAAPLPYDHYVLLSDGDTLEYGGWKLRCVETPGHTPGHMCLYDAERKALFSGDHILFHITPNICRWEAMPDALGSYLESLQTVRALPVELLFPAHREETGNLQQRVDELLAHHKRRIAEALRVVGENPGQTAYSLAGKMTWSIRSRNWAEFPLVQKFFAVGETLAHLDYLAVRGQVRQETLNEKNVYVTT
ncbi:MAG: MBL fold metallo-hydrolase [Oscillibacter sp.]